MMLTAISAINFLHKLLIKYYGKTNSEMMWKHAHTWCFSSKLKKSFNKWNKKFILAEVVGIDRRTNYGGNFLQKISHLQLKLSKVSTSRYFHFQTELIRWVIKFPKVWDRFGQFSISSTWDISILVEFGPKFDVTATKTENVFIPFLSTTSCVLFIGRSIFQIYFILFSIIIHKY